MDLPSIASILEAISFAARAHRHSLRKDGETPYVAHVFRVATIVRNLFDCDDPRVLTTCVLHDTLEDTTTDWDDLAERFGAEVATWVGFLSKDSTLPEAERERAYIAKLMSAPWQVRICKLADMTDNLLDSKHLSVEKRKSIHAKLKTYLEAIKSDARSEVQRPVQTFSELFDRS